MVGVGNIVLDLRGIHMKSSGVTIYRLFFIIAKTGNLDYFLCIMDLVMRYLYSITIYNMF